MEINDIFIRISNKNLPTWIDRFNKLLELFQNSNINENGDKIYYQSDGIIIEVNKKN